ncbi:amidohydrolase-domain-containing protein [Lentinula boryana]|uniref:Amidohydrolase-domain-containing protein n=1 Tax=Lentinula boryana TaxID=40481 RepID=A0ABQ8Q365_9AGAR|nr:amidohydrolase-domain-containing protein [Lentinula boryana]
MNVHKPLDLLRKTAFTFPVIDNHAHPLLRPQHRGKVPLETIISEAPSGIGLDRDATQTVACFRAAAQLSKVLGIETVPGQSESLWQQVKQRRDALNYEKLCDVFMKPCGIQSILLDDGLGGVSEWCEDWKWHKRFGCDTKRIVRIEIEAERLLSPLLQPLLASDFVDKLEIEMQNQLQSILVEFFHRLEVSLTESARDSEVVSFKSIVCYRGGLNVRPRAEIGIASAQTERHNYDRVVDSLFQGLLDFKRTGTIRLAHGAINEWIVHWGLRVAGEFDIPVQFHTGLGDSDISLLHASPAHMQPLITDYPKTVFVLLHAAYPFTKEAGYLCSVYPNVMLDFGEIFPMISGSGQRTVVRQVLEICPTNKILWSTDGHWHPESFYLGTVQARQALFDVLSEIVSAGELTEVEAAEIVKQALFWNSERVYKLGIKPELAEGSKVA